MIWSLCMCGFDGLLMTFDENFMLRAALEIYLLRKLVIFQYFFYML